MFTNLAIERGPHIVTSLLVSMGLSTYSPAKNLFFSRVSKIGHENHKLILSFAWHLILTAWIYHGMFQNPL